MQLSKTNPGAQHAAREIASTARILWQKGWAEGGAGNISLDVSEFYAGITMDFRTFPLVPLPKSYPNLASRFLLVTARGCRMRELADDPAGNLCLVKTNKSGDACQLLFEDLEKPNKATTELFTHLGLHNMIAARGSGEKAVLHTHATDLIALSHLPKLLDENKLNRVLLGMHSETVFFLPEGIGFIPFELPGSMELAEKTLEKLKDHQVVLWEKHGCLSIGDSISGALDKIDMFSKAARLWLVCRNAGFDPQGLSEEQLQELRTLRSNYEL
jgi:rhamnulose-1-phosphate aldolase